MSETMGAGERHTDELRMLPPVRAPTGRPKRARGNAPGNQHVRIFEPCKGGLIRAISLDHRPHWRAPLGRPYRAPDPPGRLPGALPRASLDRPVGAENKRLGCCPRLA